MDHVVFYPSAEVGPAFKRVSSLEEAVSFVEHLRNSENITEFSVHALTLVPLSFRAYYHVEVPAEDALAAPSVSSDPAPAAATDEVVAAPAAEMEPAAPAVEVESEAPVAEAEPEVAVDAAPEAVEVPAQAAAAEPVPSDEVTMAPAEATDEDRSDAWVAEAAVIEAPAEPADSAPAEAPAAAGPFAEAPPVTPNNDDVVPVPTGKRSMGFFAR